MSAIAVSTALDSFFTPWYRLHNAMRLAHLASLGLPLDGCTVLDAGCGPGDHSSFYLQRGCSVTAVDARSACLHLLARRFPSVITRLYDFDAPSPAAGLGRHDVVHCYGLLYHLRRPAVALALLSEAAAGLLVIESCFGDDSLETPRVVTENSANYTQAASGQGCLPPRSWLFAELRRLFPFAYQSRTQPAHPEFPLDWTVPASGRTLRRAVFVASRRPLTLATLAPDLLDRQEPWYPA